ncbi:class I SAM-dependent methyltransferase [Adhaeretor mobilis]|uniref:Hydroxymycolate synthase MmaA4 n=1 Tax=Adhaeretor mobilis TaxID=1930276 RepID=A0A517MYL2_9BACT|nr:class I SAM-dependent methyltransferase [Adhaeretor mobilis]QDS99978.1 Hydroxymycolate synthase MmaA4 [Adhaeretor mobilis]
MLRVPIFFIEWFVYGISYAYLQFLIRSPKPLNEEKAWTALTTELPYGLRWIRTAWPLAPLRPLLVRAKMKQDHALGIAEHYDVSNDFYELFLDHRYMFYTCADFHSPDETIEEAQQHKADHILGLIDPKPGERILELGCGWGPMLKRIAEETGDKENLYGLTLSREQLAYNEQHNGFNVEYDNFVTRDYEPNKYDAIYSIGAWEHVRQGEIPQLVEKLYGSLKPNGRMVHHFFCRTQDNLIAGAAASQIYFPGSMGAPFRHHRESFEQAGFRVAHCSVHDYRPTLRAWFDRLVENREAALKIVDVKTYNRYVTFFAASWRYFEDASGILTRWVLEKQEE